MTQTTGQARRLLPLEPRRQERWRTAVCVLLVLAGAPSARAESVFSVSVPGKTITLAPEEWSKMKDPTTVGKNFEERQKRPCTSLAGSSRLSPFPCPRRAAQGSRFLPVNTSNSSSSMRGL